MCTERRKINEILALNFNGELIEGVDQLRGKIKGHFESQFMGHEWDRPMIGNLIIPSISAAENNYLIASFSEEEVKEAVWDCGSFKSPSPDGVSFSFLMKFWGTVKYDFLGFLEDFHKNCKLVRGSNSSFIMLIL